MGRHWKEQDEVNRSNIHCGRAEAAMLYLLASGSCQLQRLEYELSGTGHNGSKESWTCLGH